MADAHINECEKTCVADMLSFFLQGNIHRSAITGAVNNNDYLLTVAPVKGYSRLGTK